MTKKRLFIDMDGTVARFHDEINYIERMFEKGFFSSLEPFENMVAGLKLFYKMHPDTELYAISAKIQSDFCIEEKSLWLDEHLFEIDQAHRIFTEMGKSKADYIPGGLTASDYLLDDYNHGLNLFLYGGGSVIKCHNNINQRGLGKYGGSAGRMWMGAMVHTSDKPEMIAAELSRHMGLEYQLETVLAAYPNICYLDETQAESETPFGYQKYLKKLSDGRFLGIEMHSGGPSYFGFIDPLNAIRALDGNEEFREYLLSTYDEQELSATALELRSVCSNTYQNADFRRYLRADRSQLAEDLLSARNAATHPIIGQVNYLNTNGSVGYSKLFFSHEELKSEISECREQGIPITEEWFIPQKTLSLHELMDFESLSERLFYDYGFGESSAANTASALLTPYRERTEDQMLDLTAAWHNHEIPGDLQTFLRLTDTEMQDYVSPSDQDLRSFSSDYVDLIHDGRISNLQPFHHTPGDSSESSILSYIGGALETDFSCFTADIDKKPVVVVCSPAITTDGFLDDYGQKRTWVQLRVCEMQKDPTLSSIQLYLEENSELEYSSSLIAVLPADTDPKDSVSYVEAFQQAFHSYLCSYSMEDLTSFRQQFADVKAMIHDTIKAIGASPQYIQKEQDWVTLYADNIACDAMHSILHMARKHHNGDYSLLTPSQKQDICKRLVNKAFQDLRKPLILEYADDAKDFERVSFIVRKGELLQAIRNMNEYWPLKDFEGSSYPSGRAHAIHLSHQQLRSGKGRLPLDSIIDRADCKAVDKDRTLDIKNQTRE